MSWRATTTTTILLVIVSPLSHTFFHHCDTDTFLVGDNKTLEQAKDMLKFVAVRTTAFATARADTSTVPVVQPTTASSSRRWAYRVLPVAVVGLGLLCCL